MPNDDSIVEFARELSSALKAFHRALILSEAGDDTALRDSPYTMLFALIGDPRFAWMGTLSQLITEIDETIANGEAEDRQQRFRELRDRSAALIGQGESQASGFRMRHVMALQKEPEVGLATGRLRQLLATKPEGLC